MQKPVHMPESLLQRCADEKIHIPGAIQSHGAFIVVSEDLTIVQASESVFTICGITHEELIGRPIAVLIGEAQ